MYALQFCLTVDMQTLCMLSGVSTSSRPIQLLATSTTVCARQASLHDSVQTASSDTLLHSWWQRVFPFHREFRRFSSREYGNESGNPERQETEAQERFHLPTAAA